MEEEKPICKKSCISEDDKPNGDCMCPEEVKCEKSCKENGDEEADKDCVKECLAALENGEEEEPAKPEPKL